MFRDRGSVRSGGDGGEDWQLGCGRASWRMHTAIAGLNGSGSPFVLRDGSGVGDVGEVGVGGGGGVVRCGGVVGMIIDLTVWM